MNTLFSHLGRALGIFTLVCGVGLLAACDSQEPGDELEDAAEEVQDAADGAAEGIEDTADDAADEMN